MSTPALTEADKEGVPPLGGDHSVRSARRVVPVAILIIVLLVAAFLIGYRLGKPDETYGQAILSPHVNSEGAAANAIALVTGLMRQSDGLIFGEWAKLRILRECPGLSPSDYTFRAFGQGPWQSEIASVGRIRWDVYIGVRTGTKLEPRTCEDPNSYRHSLASIWSDTGEIHPLAYTPGRATFRVGTRGELSEDSPSGEGTWLQDFRSGASP